MDFKTYREQVGETNIFVDTATEYSCIMAGLAGEVIEVLEKISLFDFDGAVIEIGDCLWYAATIANHFKLSISEYADKPPLFEAHIDLCIHAKNVSEVMKKAQRDSKLPDLAVIRTQIELILNAAAWVSCVCGADFSMTLEKNLEKLAKRKKAGVISGEGDNRK